MVVHTKRRNNRPRTIPRSLPFLFFFPSGHHPSMLFVRPTDSSASRLLPSSKGLPARPTRPRALPLLTVTSPSSRSLFFPLLVLLILVAPRPLLYCFPCRRVVVLQMNGLPCNSREASPVRRFRGREILSPPLSLSLTAPGMSKYATLPDIVSCAPSFWSPGFALWLNRAFAHRIRVPTSLRRPTFRQRSRTR